VETEDMQNANALGEFKKAYNLIRLNRSRELDARQWEAVVAHEVGHFLLLDHSKDPLSVMSNNIHVNDDDVANAKNMKKLLYYKQLLFKFADKISFR
jgi:Zn-dependent peptidase ImmA (M78 family)